MSFEEIAVIGLCLVGGYWGVSFLFDRRRRESHMGLSARERAVPAGEAAPTPMLPWTTVLGISPDASIEQIRRAYQVRIGELHLDKAAVLGAEARELAKRKSRQIEAAYDEACRARRGRA